MYEIQVLYLTHPNTNCCNSRVLPSPHQRRSELKAHRRGETNSCVAVLFCRRKRKSNAKIVYDVIISNGCSCSAQKWLVSAALVKTVEICGACGGIWYQCMYVARTAACCIFSLHTLYIWVGPVMKHTQGVIITISGHVMITQTAGVTNGSHE